MFFDPNKIVVPLPLSPGRCPPTLWIEHAAALDGLQTAAAAGLVGGILSTVHTGTIITVQPR